MTTPQPSLKHLLDETRGAYEPSAQSKARVHWALEAKLQRQHRKAWAPQRPARFALVFALALLGGGALAQLGGFLPMNHASEEQSPGLQKPKSSPHLSADGAESDERSGQEAARQDTALGSDSSTHQGVSKSDTSSGLPVSAQGVAGDSVVSAKGVAGDSFRSQVSSGQSAVGGVPAAKTSATKAERAQNSLRAELDALRDANVALRAGNPAQALSILDAYSKSSQGSRLGQERTAARVLSLCQLGRTAEGRAQFERFARSYPKSPQLPRLRSACGILE